MTKGFDTFLNLSTIPKSLGAAHGATTLSAMRTVPGTLRGTQSATVRLHPDFENLHAFLNREHEIPRARDPAASSRPASATTGPAAQRQDASGPSQGRPPPAGRPPPVRPMSDFADWEAQMERDLALAKRRSVASHAAAAAAATAAATSAAAAASVGAATRKPR